MHLFPNDAHYCPVYLSVMGDQARISRDSMCVNSTYYSTVFSRNKTKKPRL